MPISFDLEALRNQYNCKVYFETGLWDPRTDSISCRKALTSGFDKVYNMEIREDWVSLGKEIFSDDIRSGRLTLIRDDSNNMKNYLDKQIFRDNRAIFFLDAHVDNSNIKNYMNRCPLFNELDAIKNLERKDHIILVDDMRIIRQPFPWGETSYGNINFLENIQSTISSINSEYKFTFLDGHVKDDVLLAYLE